MHQFVHKYGNIDPKPQVEPLRIALMIGVVHAIVCPILQRSRAYPQSNFLGRDVGKLVE